MSSEQDKKAIRVMVVDDHTLMREGVAAVMARQTDMVVMGQAADGIEALTLIDQQAPDVLLLDLRMPKLDGVAVIERLRAKHSHIGIIVLSTYDSDDDIIRALRAGAKAYLLKDTPPDELANCVRAVHEGRTYVSATVGAKLAAQATQASLTFRELDVIKLIAQGYLNKEIADRLNITEGTVKSHTSALFSKLGVANRTEAVREAVRRGLVRLE